MTSNHFRVTLTLQGRKCIKCGEEGVSIEEATLSHLPIYEAFNSLFSILSVPSKMLPLSRRHEYKARYQDGEVKEVILYFSFELLLQAHGFLGLSHLERTAFDVLHMLCWKFNIRVDSITSSDFAHSPEAF